MAWSCYPCFLKLVQWVPWVVFVCTTHSQGARRAATGIGPKFRCRGCATSYWKWMCLVTVCLAVGSYRVARCGRGGLGIVPARLVPVW